VTLDEAVALETVEVLADPGLGDLERGRQLGGGGALDALEALQHPALGGAEPCGRRGDPPRVSQVTT